jgi:hypothetical protein
VVDGGVFPEGADFVDDGETETARDAESGQGVEYG